MRRSMIMVIAMAILVGTAIAAAAPAAAESNVPVLHRDGDQAVPFDPVVGGGGEPVLRRDGSQSVPFVAETGPEATPAGSGFDWGDAMIGAATTCCLMLLGAGALLVHRRDPAGHPGWRRA